MKEIKVTSNQYKNKYLMSQNALIDFKFKNNNEVINDLLGYYQKQAYFYYAKEYNVTYEIAKEVLDATLLVDNIDYNDKKLNELVTIKNKYKKYLKFDKYARKLYSLGVNSFYFPSNKYTKAVKNLNINYYEENLRKDLVCNEFNSVYEEVVYLANEITRLLSKGYNPDKILINKPQDYYFPVINQVFTNYNIDFDLEKHSIMSNPDVLLFYRLLESYGDISIKEGFVKAVEESNINKDVVDVLNDYYTIDGFVRDVIPFIHDDLKNKQVKVNYKNCIKFVDLYEQFITDEIVFIIGFNQGVIPAIHKDIEYLEDTELRSLGLKTSIDLNKEEEKISISILNKSYRISYSLLSLQGSLLPSSFIKKYGIEICEKNELPINKKELERHFASRLDDFYLYGKLDSEMKSLAGFLGYRNGNVLNKGKYDSYDNSYNGSINFKKFNLSYTSIESYNQCSFKYYLENVIKVKKPFDKSHIIVGNLFHECLSKNQDVEVSCKEFIENNPMTKEELFYINKLASIINEVNEFNDFKSNYTESSEEFDVSVMVNNHYINGKIDKAFYNGDNVVIVDYKTGTVDHDLKPMYHGLHMQLPMYMFFMHNTHNVDGIFYQKVLPKSIFVDKNRYDELNKYFKYDGYCDLDKVKDFDPTLSHLAGIKMLKDNSYSKSSLGRNLATKKELILDKLNEKLALTINNIESGKFDINPKEYKGNTACSLCVYKDICYRSSTDFVKLEVIDWLGDSDDSEETV